MTITLLSVTPDAEKIIELAGRTCYKSEPGNHAIIQKWIAAGHLSVIEHASATFRASGVSRALTHQLVRHRVASYSQESQRYIEQKSAKFICPESVIANPALFAIYDGCIDRIQKAYAELVKYGIPKEDARYLLPNATQTEIVFTMNFRELRHFFELRCDRHAQWEIHDMSKEMLSMMIDIAPNVFGDMKELLEVGR